MSRDQRLAATFVELADTLVEDFEVIDLMVVLGERCVELLDADAAGLLLADDTGALQLVAATSDATETVELFELQNDEGPCRDCFHTGLRVDAADLDADRDRWPRMAPVALAAGFRAVDAFPMSLRGNVLGALNLLRHTPGSMSRDDIVTAQALADVASIGLLQSRALADSQMLSDQLRQALRSRIAIEQAKGIVAQSRGCTVGDAFALLRTYARQRRLGIADVARTVVEGWTRPDAL